MSYEVLKVYALKTFFHKKERKVLELSQRLRVVGDFVTQKTVADIEQTTPMFLFIYIERRSRKVIACDINQNPLEKAQQNIKAYHAENIITTRLGNGLQPLQPNEVDTIIISGMGGNAYYRIIRTISKK